MSESLNRRTTGRTAYLADLTHTTITVSNDSFPLNIGLVAAYAKTHFPEWDFQLFKFPEDLLAALDSQMPMLVGFSNYPWNHRLNLSFCDMIKRRNPKVMTVFGGPYISYRKEDQFKLMSTHRDRVDFYAMFEGETSFASLLEAAIANDFDLPAIKAQGVEGCLNLKADGTLCDFKRIERSRALDEYPSPYLDGTLDKFFALPLSPMVETHRGCPYSCTYCHEGHDFYAKIGRHSLQRMADEVTYIGRHADTRMSTLMFADPNFGIFPEHVELARVIRRVGTETGYPRIIFATTAKNSKDRLVAIGKELGDISMPIWMSVQSMNEEVLSNIKRRNISTADMLAVQKVLADDGLTTKSELILCLPGETFATHLQSMVDLLRIGIDSIVCYQLMVLDGSEMQESFDGDNEWGMQTHYRVLPRSFTDRTGDLNRSIEVERIVTATKDLSFDDYLEARKLHLLINITYNGRAFSGFFRLLRETGADLTAFMAHLLELFTTEPGVDALLEQFVADTRGELFDSEEALLGHYADDRNFNALIRGDAGANLIQKYASLAFFHHSAAVVRVLSKAAIRSVGADPKAQLMIEDVAAYYAQAFDGFLDPGRLDRVTRVRLGHDVAAWLASPGRGLGEFKCAKPLEVQFHTPAAQFKLVEDLLDSFGRGPQEFGKAMTRMWIGDMLRQPLSPIDAKMDASSV